MVEEERSTTPNDSPRRERKPWTGKEKRERKGRVEIPYSAHGRYLSPLSTYTVKDTFHAKRDRIYWLRYRERGVDHELAGY